MLKTVAVRPSIGWPVEMLINKCHLDECPVPLMHLHRIPIGDLYFTDPPYGLEKGLDDPNKELGFQGVYRVRPDGEVILLTDQIRWPNGIAFSPDEKTLYVGNSDPQYFVWMAYDEPL